MAVKRKSGRPAKIPGEKDTRERIFDTAVDLFAARGYDGVSVRDIAAAVGIRESSVYKHYTGKDEILDRIIDYPMARIGIIGPPGVKTEELIVTTGLEDFMAMAGDVFTGWMEDPYMVKIFRIICVEAYHNEQIKKCYLNVVTAAYSFWVSNFGIMRKHKLIKPCDPKMLSRELLSFIWSAYLDYFLFCYDHTSGSFPQAYRENIYRHVAFIVNSIKP